MATGITSVRASTPHRPARTRDASSCAANRPGRFSSPTTVPMRPPCASAPTTSLSWQTQTPWAGAGTRTPDPRGGANATAPTHS